MTKQIVFAPGCFDNFEGTQEELDEMIAELRKMVADDTLLENAEPIDPEDEQMFLDAMQARLNRPPQ
jgi:hypothetical protein